MKSTSVAPALITAAVIAGVAAGLDWLSDLCLRRWAKVRPGDQGQVRRKAPAATRMPEPQRASRGRERRAA